MAIEIPLRLKYRTKGSAKRTKIKSGGDSGIPAKIGEIPRGMRRRPKGKRYT